MPTIKSILITSLFFYATWAIFDYFNKTSWLLLPYTTLKGALSGTTDPTVSTLNSPPATGN